MQLQARLVCSAATVAQAASSRLNAGSGGGGASQEQVRNQIAVLNAAYASASFVFQLVFSQIVQNSAWRVLCLSANAVAREQPTTKSDPHLGMPPPPGDCGNVQLLEAACSGTGSAVCRCAPLQGPPSSAGTRHCKIRTPHPPNFALRRNPLPYPSENYLNMKRQLHVGGAADLNLWITDIASGSLIGCAICRD